MQLRRPAACAPAARPDSIPSLRPAIGSATAPVPGSAHRPTVPVARRTTAARSWLSRNAPSACLRAVISANDVIAPVISPSALRIAQTSWDEGTWARGACRRVARYSRPKFMAGIAGFFSASSSDVCACGMSVPFCRHNFSSNTTVAVPAHWHSAQSSDGGGVHNAEDGVPGSQSYTAVGAASIISRYGCSLSRNSG